MSRKYILLAIVLAVAALAVFATPTYAKPFYSPHVLGWNMVLADLDGNVINPTNYPEVKEVLIMVWNESQNCLIAYYKGPPTDDGNYTLTLVNKTKVVDWISTPQFGKYNVTILLRVVFPEEEARGETQGRWMLFNWSDDINPNGISASELVSYHNETIYSWHWWRLEFTALTNIMDPSVFNVTLWDYDPEFPSREFIAHFKVYWGDTTDNLIWVNDAQGRDGGNYNATAARTFNTSDTWVEISPTGLEGCFHIDALHNVTILKETYWRLWTNPGEWRYVKVGESLLEFNYTLYHWNSIYLNETDLEHTPNVPTNWEVQYNLTYYADPNAGNDPAGDGKAVFSWFDTVKDINSLGAGGIVRPASKPTALDPDGWNWTFANHAYTMLLNGQIWELCSDLDLTGKLDSIGTWPHLKAFIIAYLNGSAVELYGVQLNSAGGFPAEGSGRLAELGYPAIWMPEITRIYGSNVTLKILVGTDNPASVTRKIFEVNFNTTQVLLQSPVTFDRKAKGQTIRYAATRIEHPPINTLHSYWKVHIDAKTSLLKVLIRIKDLEPIYTQPMPNLRIYIISSIIDDFPTYTTTGGVVELPFFQTFGMTLEGIPVVTPAEDSGYLPVPFEYVFTGDNFTYTIKAEVLVSSDPANKVWIPVLEETFELNATTVALGFLQRLCIVHTFNFTAELYDVNVEVVDLCGRHLSINDWSQAALVVTYETHGVTAYISASLDPDNYGVTTIGKLPVGEIKAIQLYFKGMLLDPINFSAIEVTGNLLDAPKITFPVGDFAPQITQWDVPEPLLNITVGLQIYKDGKLVHEEETKLTNCTGQVVFEKIPMVPAANAGHSYDIFLVAWTNEHTPYIRPQDAGLLVMNYSVIEYLEKNYACTVDGIFPAWIYSFTAIATDHEGNVLTTLKTDVGDYPVIFAFNDTIYGTEFPLWLYCTQYPCYCYPNITVDFRIINATASEYDNDFNALRPGMVAASEEAKFAISSSQTNVWLNGEGDHDKYPHLFVAGARFHVVVWDGGVLVYNYTITLPKPYESGVVFFNESTYEIWTLTDWSELNYTWAEEDGDIAHPILRFTGSKNWTSGGERYDTKLEFVTWEQTLEIYTLSNAGDHMIPHLNLTLVRNDVINITTFAKESANFGKFYYNLTDIADRFSYWAKDYPTTLGNMTSYAWNAVDEDGDGIIKIRVPVWLPIRDGSFWTETLWAPMSTLRYVEMKFGANIIYVLVLAGSNWNSPSVPDTPHNSEFCIGIDNSLNNRIWHHVFGYVVNWNHTYPYVEWWPTDNDGNRVFYAEWYKLYEGSWIGPFYGDNDYWLGDWWNMTYWSGAAKVVHTIAMDLYCVEVYGPDLRDELIPLANQPVNTTALGYVEGSIEWGPEYTDENGKAVFKPVTSGSTTLPDGTSLPIAVDEVAYKFDVPYAGSYTINDVAYIEYMLETWYNYEDLVKSYAELAGMTPKEFVNKVLKQFALYRYVNFTEDNNSDEVCVSMIWDAIKFTVEDWSGQPLKNQLVTAWLRYVTDSSGDNPAAINLPSAMAFTFENGSVILYVPSSVIYTRPTGVTYVGTPKYEVVVYWLDSYLLKQAGAIEKWTDIYTSKEDPTWGERYYAPGEGGTLQTYVYTGTFRLVGQDGSDLPPELIQKLKVKIVWPDHRITMTTLENGGITSDGTVKMVMNKDTLVTSEPSWATWRQPESPMNKPQTPIGPFTVTVYIGDTEVVTKTLRVHKARQDMPEIAVTPSQIILAVAKDITVKFSTPFGTPMAGAEVEVSGPAVETVDTAGTYTANEEGVITIPYVLLGTSTGTSFTPAKITINVKTWRGMTVSYSKEDNVQPSMSIVVPKIGKLTVKVVGSRGQGIAGADVTISGPITIKGATDDAGVFSVELVEGSWSVTAEKGGKTASASATVTGGKEATVELKIDIFMTIAGWEVSISEFTGLLLLIVILVIVLFILAHEYSVWRRKRIAKALVPAKPE